MPLAALVLALTAVPIALAAGSGPQPGQRIDMKVLVLAKTTEEAASWQAALQREGVPFDVLATSTTPITDATLADYGANRAKYQAVIAVDPAGLGLTAEELAALSRLESTFGIRQISDNVYPGPSYGLNTPPAGVELGGTTATLTAAGKAVFPYLKGSVPIGASSWGYPTTPQDPSFQTLLEDANHNTLLGVQTRADGTEQMVVAFASNQNQSHNQLLRHGLINWVTRGVYLGTQRNYLELQVDDTFLGDDIWDPATHTTDYDSAHAVRMTADDVTFAVNWMNSSGIKIDNVFNGGGSAAYAAEHGLDPLLAAFKANVSAFNWINHTFEHPNLDCTTATYTAKQFTDNIAFANANGLPIDAGELVTGEHSGLSNTRPGNPGTIDPPVLDGVDDDGSGTLVPGTYEYGVSATTAAGETPASTSQTTVGANGAATVRWEAICGATSYKVYRRPDGGSWSLIDTISQPATAFSDSGAVLLSTTDTGAVGAAATPPIANTAVRAPYSQNPSLIDALTSAGIKVLAGDASKDYQVDGTTFAAGALFTDGPARVVPRYPTNVYYNTATQAQQLDEYNWLYTKPSGGGACVDIPGVTTCNDAPVSWAQYVDNEVSIMLGHVQGNDPRPHYFHQTNIARTADADGGVLYPVIGSLLDRYRALYAENAPLVQLSPTQIADTLSQQAQWAKDMGNVTAYLQDGQVHITTTATTDVPVTGTTVGSAYGGQRSGWATVTAGSEMVLDPVDPANTAVPTISGTTKVGSALTATTGTWSGTPTIDISLQWMRCDASGEACAAIANATSTTHVLTADDLGRKLRVVALAGNAISSVSQARSAATDTIASADTTTTPTTTTPPSGAGGGGAATAKVPTTASEPAPSGDQPTGAEPAQQPTAQRSPSRNALTVTRVRVRHGRVSWRLSGAAKVTVRYDRSAAGRRVLGTCKAQTRSTRNRPACRRYVTVKASSLVAKAGNGSTSVPRGLAPGRYRVTVGAVDAMGRRAAGRAATLVVKGA